MSTDKVQEEVAANNAGSGAIDGMGAGEHPKSEPGVNKKRKLSTIINTCMLRRNKPN